MNIAIVSSCLEPGKDGVGDYSQLLASQLEKLGHSVFLISWNDGYVPVPQKETDSNTLRLPKSLAKKDRCTIAKDWIENKNIEYISIQIVSYGYNTKGIFMDHFYLKSLCNGVKTHVHFHELWVGMETNAPLKQRILGLIQRKCLISFIQYLRPNQVTTSIELYQLLLKENKIHSQLLPIFGNIEKVELPTLEIQDKEFKSIHLIKSKIGTEPMLKVVLFGRIYPLVDLKRRLREIKKQYTTAPILCIQLGRTSNESIEKLEITCKEISIDFVTVGGVDPREVSAVLQYCDIGCSLMSGVFALKSGANHALFEHGKKVFYLDDFPLPPHLKPQDYKNHNGLFCTFTDGMDLRLHTEKEALGSESIAKKWLDICQ